MTYLCIRTDAPRVEFVLCEGLMVVDRREWQADRQLAFGILSELEDFLSANHKTFENLDGLAVYRGPGSFTGLRIGITVMNTVAYARGLPIVGAESDAWCQAACVRLENGENDEIVLPFYGAEARITKPRK